MHSPQFALISKAYSDGVSLEKDGPKVTKNFTSECILVDEKTYRTEAFFIPKLVAKHFVTTLTVGEELTYFESIAFERRTVSKKFSETTNIFIPKDTVNNYCSSLIFEPNATKRLYKEGIELIPAQKIIVAEENLNCNVKDVATKYGEKRPMNGAINDSQKIINGNK